jgi:serine/threonine protein kinase
VGWRLGPYRVDDRPFAAGATAEVFVARRGRTGPRVAIKVLPLRTFRVRAEAEAEVAAIDHPRLLTVHERVEDERRGVVGLVMDLVAEGDLRTALRGPNAPTPTEMLQITDDVLAALDALHAAGLVHRDIKPENVMLERVDGALRARLGDMGIARPADRTRSTGSVLGTDLYIAPEVHDGAVPSSHADLWAVGYVLYEGLFGAPPHADASTTYQAIGRLRAEGPDRPPNIPDAIWRVVACLLAPTPTDRPSSAAAARELVASAGPAAAAASPRESSSLPGRRRITPRGRTDGGFDGYGRSPRVARVMAGSVAVVLLVGVLAWMGGRDRLHLFGHDPSTLGAISSITPLSAESPDVVPTQYQWRLRDGVLTGRLEVSNPSSAAVDATVMPELFPVSAATDGALALVGFNGATERQKDGSTLVRFAVPPLAPHAHHIVSFRLTINDVASDRRVLDQLVHDRQSAINRHAFALSDAPTLDRIVVTVASSSLTVGQQTQVHIAGFARTGSPASAELMRGLHVVVVSGQGVAQLDGTSVAAIAPGHAVIRAVVGDIQGEAPVTVASAPPETAPPTTARRVVRKPTPKATPTTETTTFEEEESPPPETVVV